MFRRISINTIASFTGRILGIVVSLVTIGLITRSLGAENFGNYSTIFAYLLSIQSFADFGLNTLLTRELAQHNKNQHNRIFAEFFTTRLILIVVMILIGCTAIFLFPYEETVKMGVVIGSFAILSMSLSQIFLGVFQTNLTVYKFSIAELIGRLSHLVLVITLIVMGLGFYWYIAVFGIAVFIVFIISLFFTRKEIAVRIKINKPRIKSILKTSLPIATSIVLTILYFRSDTIMLSIIKGAESTGYYNAAYKVLESFIFFPAMFIGLFLPIMSKKAKEGAKEFSKVVSFLLNIVILFSIPVVVGGVLLSSSIINIIGGSEFLPATTTLQILFIAIGIISISTIFSNAVIVLNIQKQAVKIYAVGFIFNIIANLIMIPRFSYNGAAYSTLVTEFMVAIALIYIVYKSSKFKVSPTIVALSIISSIAMGYVVFSTINPIKIPISPLTTIGITFIGTIVYLSIVSTSIPKIYNQYKQIRIS